MTEQEESPDTEPTSSSESSDDTVKETPITWYHDWVQEHLDGRPQTPERVAIITGSDSGTGFWCAKALSQTGSTVVMACRNLEKAKAARDLILEEHPAAKLDVIHLDNSKLDTVREFVKSFQAKYDRIDWLVNHASVMALPYEKTEDGHEIQWQTNHLGHFLLTKLLWETLLATPDSETRIIQVSSNYHHIGAPKFDPSQMEFPPCSIWAWPLWNLLLPLAQMPKDFWARYGVSKLCNILFMKALAEKINQFEILKASADDGKKVLSIACHPGHAQRTDLQEDAMGLLGAYDYQTAQSAADGSLPLLKACLSQEVHNGDYLGPETFHLKGLPIHTTPGGFANDPQQIQLLWEYSEECIGETFELSW